MKKFEDYNPDRSVYVIDVRQSLYMQQIYKTLEVMGHPDWAKRCYHMSYEIVNLPGNVTLASRDGTVVLLEDLVREAKARALQVVEQKNPALSESEMQQVAHQVALGAIKYPMLARDNTKVVTFDWQTALDFNGQAAPYIQYAHVRANSILRRMERDATRFLYAFLRLRASRSPAGRSDLAAAGERSSAPLRNISHCISPTWHTSWLKPSMIFTRSARY